MKRVHFLCSRNRLRNPKAEQVSADWAGVETALLPGAEYPVWTPVDAESAAADLLDFLARSNISLE